jgi:hypothetical protein
MVGGKDCSKASHRRQLEGRAAPGRAPGSAPARPRKSSTSRARSVMISPRGIMWPARADASPAWYLFLAWALAPSGAGACGLSGPWYVLHGDFHHRESDRRVDLRGPIERFFAARGECRRGVPRPTITKGRDLLRGRGGKPVLLDSGQFHPSGSGRGPGRTLDFQYFGERRLRETVTLRIERYSQASTVDCRPR